MVEKDMREGILNKVEALGKIDNTGIWEHTDQPNHKKGKWPQNELFYSPSSSLGVLLK